MDPSSIKQKFKERFSKEPLLIRSPGRINLIGEHTDYNEGLVLPAAIDKSTLFAIALNNTNDINLYASDMDVSYTCHLDNVSKTDIFWANYLLGVIAQLKKDGHALKGFDCVFGGDIPIGAGLSSSAALECGCAVGLNELFQLNIGCMDLVKLCQKAEHEYTGTKCGIMDQFICMFGKQDHAVNLDCRSLAFEYVPANMNGYKIILCNTQIKHALAASAYNTRQDECKQGVETIKKYYPGISTLRDVSLDMLEKNKEELGLIPYKRCRFVIKENSRVEKACQYLGRDDMISLGAQMYLSHQGLRNEYDVSCKELDFLVEQTFDDINVAGARMIGGGFGGCTINIVNESYVPVFSRKMADAYRNKFDRELECYIITINEGIAIL